MTARRSPPSPPRRSPRSSRTAAPAKEAAPHARETPSERAPFPIVGIGASAGGLEALEQFLANVPKDSGMAFVIVQHQDPTQKGMLVELLQRATPLPVVQLKDRQRVLPGHVYVIPPNKDLSILHGVLHLLAPTAARGLRLPIDYFLRSLAEDRQDRAVGVILSGMGTDGTLGVRAIKEKAGAVFVQAPDSAKFGSMPRSAIEARLADVVAPATELPARIAAYLRHPATHVSDGPVQDGKALSGMDKVLILLRAHTGHDFSMYKKTTVFRRIERRMSVHQIDGIASYVRFLGGNTQELDLLFRELLIGVTSFFRDPAAWDILQSKAIPELLASRRPGQPLRVWVPGCSTGEEAFSLAMVLTEAMDHAKSGEEHGIQIFATDLDTDAVARAREGTFLANIAADVSPERLDRFFQPVAGGYQIAASIREMMIFAPQNIVMDPPFTRLDILSCRNLLIYLVPELQKKLIPLFHYSLNPGGLLFLGSAETVGTFDSLFTPLQDNMRIYRRIEPPGGAEPVAFPSSFTRPLLEARGMAVEPPAAEIQPVQNLQDQADRLLLQRFSPAAVLVNSGGDILYVSGRTGKYLEPAAGRANWNIFAMARESLRYELPNAFRKALTQDNAVTLSSSVEETGGTRQAVDVTVQALREPEGLRGTVLIVFTDAPPPDAGTGRTSRRTPKGDSRLAAMARELQQSRQETRIAHEQMRTTQEELKSYNEELQSSNEELQSTNEELTTSKEELQSLNEELQTVNQELRAKVDDLSRVNDDMKNLLDSTDIATIFLDSQLRVRRFTSQAAKLTPLISADIGRPITDIASDLLYPDMVDDVRGVLQSLISVDRQVSLRDGRWYAARIMPYRTLTNVIDGVVMTFMDITVTKELESRLRQQRTGGPIAGSEPPS